MRALPVVLLVLRTGVEHLHVILLPDTGQLLDLELSLQIRLGYPDIRVVDIRHTLLYVATTSLLFQHVTSLGREDDICRSLLSTIVTLYVVIFLSIGMAVM